MKKPPRIHPTSICLTALVIFGASCGSSGGGLADGVESPIASSHTIVSNAAVYTVDAGRSWAEAFAYDKQGRIFAVGTEEEVRAAADDDAKILDAGGLMVLPGFQDAHVHVPEGGINASLCFMSSGETLETYERLARQCAEEQPDDEWVRAAGPSLYELRNSSENPLDVLDRAIPDRPAIILDDLGHAVWTNSLGLAAAGIDDDSDDPQGGVFHRDAVGRLTGLLLEDAQQRLRNAAAASDDVVYSGLLDALDELARNGVTTVSDAGGYWAQGHPAAWERALREDSLVVRAANTLYLYPDLDPDTQLTEFERRFSNDSDLLRFDTAKVYVDGILDLGTAFLLEPYDTAPDENYPSGFTYFELDQLNSYVSHLHEIGYRINFHAIGDAGVRAALDAVAAIEDSADSVADRRHRLTHVYMVEESDTARFAELGVVADYQQSADAIDPLYHEDLTQIIGNRAWDLLPTRRVLDASATVTLSSDWDAGPLPPLGTIQRSLTREGNAVPNLETALALATINTAYALGHDDVTGSIEVGKFADFVILDQDIFEVEVDKIDETEVLLTAVAGRVVYDAGSLSG